MTKYVNEGDLVEGAKCSIATRKNTWKGLRKDPVTEKLFTLYELDRNCRVEVTESISLESIDDQKLRNLKNIHCSVGDLIEGESIQLYVNSKRRSLDFNSIEGYSHRHGVQLENTKTRTIGRLKYSFHSFRNLGETSNNKNIEKI